MLLFASNKTHKTPWCYTLHQLLPFQAVGGARPTLCSWWTSRPASAPTTLSKSKTLYSAWPHTSPPSAPRPRRLVEVDSVATVAVRSQLIHWPPLRSWPWSITATSLGSSSASTTSVTGTRCSERCARCATWGETRAQVSVRNHFHQSAQHQMVCGNQWETKGHWRVTDWNIAWSVGGKIHSCCFVTFCCMELYI